MQNAFVTEIAGYDIILQQNSAGLFAVTYGQHNRTELDYAGAAAELGACIMHALACAGSINNDVIKFQ